MCAYESSRPRRSLRIATRDRHYRLATFVQKPAKRLRYPASAGYSDGVHAGSHSLVSPSGMVETPRLQAKHDVVSRGRVRPYRLGAHTKSDLKVHLVWVPKYRQAVLTGEVALRVRDLLRQIAMEHELEIVSGKGARDHVHLFLWYRPNQDVSHIVQWLKGISSRVLLQEFAHLRKKFWGRHLWARGYLG